MRRNCLALRCPPIQLRWTSKTSRPPSQPSLKEGLIDAENRPQIHIDRLIPPFAPFGEGLVSRDARIVHQNIEAVLWRVPF